MEHGIVKREAMESTPTTDGDADEMLTEIGRMLRLLLQNTAGTNHTLTTADDKSCSQQAGMRKAR